MLSNLLLFRLTIANLCGFALLTWAWTLGYVQQVFKGDISHISYVIAALFAVGLVSTFWRATKVSAALNETKAGVPTVYGRRKLQAAASKMHAKSAHVGDVAEWLVTLGLIGNVIGFVIALRGVNVGAVGTAEGAQEVAAQLLMGMGVAFYSTLAGSVLALWTTINRRMLETATSLLVEDVR